MVERDFALALFALTGRDFDLVERALVFLLRALVPLDFIVPEREAFLGRSALTARFAMGTAARAVFATGLVPRAA